MFSRNMNTVTERGIVRAFSIRIEQIVRFWGAGDITVWSFRLENTDSSDEPTSLMSIEMRGPTFEGIVHEGDSVSVSGIVRNGTLIGNSGKNITTGAAFGPKGKVFHRTLVTIALVAAVTVGALAAIQKLNLPQLALNALVKSSAVNLTDCYILSNGGWITNEPLGGTQLARLDMTALSPYRYHAYRRGDIPLSLISVFEIEYEGVRGWLDPVWIASLEGGCMKSGQDAAHGNPEPQVTSTPSPMTILMQAFPEIDEHVLQNAERLDPPCIASPFGHGLLSIDLYGEPSLISRKVGQLPRGSQHLALLYHKDNWYYLDVDGLRGWAHQHSVNINCNPVPEPTSQGPQEPWAQMMTTTDLSNCVLRASGGFLQNKPFMGANVGSLFPNLKNPYVLQASKRAEVMMSTWFEVPYNGQKAWMNSIYVDSMSGDCMNDAAP